MIFFNEYRIEGLSHGSFVSFWWLSQHHHLPTPIPSWTSLTHPNCIKGLSFDRIQCSDQASLKAIYCCVVFTIVSVFMLPDATLSCLCCLLIDDLCLSNIFLIGPSEFTIITFTKTRIRLRECFMTHNLELSSFLPKTVWDALRCVMKVKRINLEDLDTQ